VKVKSRGKEKEGKEAGIFTGGLPETRGDVKVGGSGSGANRSDRHQQTLLGSEHVSRKSSPLPDGDESAECFRFETSARARTRCRQPAQVVFLSLSLFFSFLLALDFP